MSSLTALHWREPLWLLLMLQPLLLMGVPAWLRRRQHRASTHWIDRTLQPWVLQVQPKRHTRPGWQQITLFIAWLLLAIAAAGPRLPPADANGDASGNGGAGQDLVLLVDASRSMRATDTHPSRLRRARVEIHELLQRVPAARVALLLYAGKAHQLVPPTSDHQALNSYLQQLDRLPMPSSGSNSVEGLQLALDTAMTMQQQRRAGAATPTNNAKPRTSAAVIWFTDGDFPASQAPALQTLSARFQEQQLPLSILGLGTPAGAGIPLRSGGWLSQPQGAVVTRMNAPALQQLADRAAGQFSPVKDDDSDWQQLYHHNIAARLPAAPVQPGQVQWRELFPWALAPAVALLLLAGLGNHQQRRSSGFALPMLLPLLALLGSPPPTQAAETAGLRQAWQLYQNGDYSEAIQAYAAIRGYAARMGEASANYRSGQFDHASEQFAQALLLADSDSQRADALYNLGNSRFREGRYGEAGEAFADALRYNPALADSRFNLDLSQALQAAVNAAQRREQGGGLAGNARIGGRIEGEIDPNDDNAFVSDGASSMPAIIAALPQSPLGRDANQALAQQLVARGLASAAARAPASNDKQSPQDAQRARENLVRARLGMAELDGRQPQLWKRLFEMEEGFPAPLDEPRSRPGLPPW